MSRLALATRHPLPGLIDSQTLLRIVGEIGARPFKPQWYLDDIFRSKTLPAPGSVEMISLTAQVMPCLGFARTEDFRSLWVVSCASPWRHEYTAPIMLLGGFAESVVSLDPGGRVTGY